jgi:hypothetical protein
MRAIAKLILNSNYGYLGLSEDKSKSEIIQKSETVKDNSEQNIENLNDELCIQARELREEEEVNVDKDYLDTINIAIAAIIAAEARMFMLPYRLYGYTVYTDTDSIISSGLEEFPNMEIDPVKIGAFKKEYTFKEFTAIKKKIYALLLDNNTEVVVSAGIPNNILTYKDLKDLYKNGKIISKDTFINKLEDEKFILNRCKVTFKLDLKNNNIMKVYDEEDQ